MYEVEPLIKTLENMRSFFRFLCLGLLALVGATAMAQNSITVMGSVTPCDSTSYSVWLLSDTGTTPAIDTVINTTANCTYSYTFYPINEWGGIAVMLSCDNGLTWGAADSAYYTVNTYDTLVVDLSCGGTITDCLGISGGTNLPGTACDDGNPITTGDTWSANCICVGTVCQAPVITSLPQTLTICSSDSLVLLASTTGTGPMTYNWTGPGTFIPNNTSQTVYFHDFTSGTYHVTVANDCGTAEADVIVTITQAPDAGISVDTSLCGATAPVTLLSLLGGSPDAGGMWSINGAPHSLFYDPAVDLPGVYVHTVAGTAPCPNASATVTITGIPTWYGDADGDGLGDLGVSVQSCIQPVGYVSNDADACPFAFGTIGSACDDGNPLTSNDHLDFNCACVGTDSTLVDCLGLPGGNNMPGTLCTDSLGNGGSWSTDCDCVVGTFPNTCNADFWVIQAYDSTATGIEPIPNEVWVWNLSSGTGNFQFVWDFGDGTTSTEAYPTHEYDGPGPWQLCLSMTSDSCIDTHCDSLSMDANGILNQLVIDGGGTVGHEAGSGSRSGGFTLNVIQQIPTGITEISAFGELKAWPNPVLNELNLSFNTNMSGTVPVTVIDPIGRTVIASSQQLTSGSNTFRISTSTLEPGLYMVRIGNDARSITQRFMKVQ